VHQLVNKWNFDVERILRVRVVIKLVNTLTLKQLNVMLLRCWLADLSG